LLALKKAGLLGHHMLLLICPELCWPEIKGIASAAITPGDKRKEERTGRKEKGQRRGQGRA
jgi:hypothetical protein